MIGSAVVYFGLLIALCGLALVVKPSDRLWISTRFRGLIVTAVGILVTAIGLTFPSLESRAQSVTTALDAFVPVWQFGEFHTIAIDAPPARVFEAIERVRAGEIFLFRALTWIRRGGQPLPRTILQAGEKESLIDVAIASDFVQLHRDYPRELVIGTIVLAPSGVHEKATPQMFRKSLRPGFALAAMNFLVTPDGKGGSMVSTETRVYANSSWARLRFAAYWRLIYPGSAIIRRMWLRAIRRRATDPNELETTAVNWSL